MGVNGLLQALKPIAKQVHVRKYSGQRVAVDGYSWLHKGAYCCARELCEGIWTDKFVVYFISRIQLLRTNGLEPIVVFDGGRLPIKGEEEESRRRARTEARDKAAAHLAAGNVAMAHDCYQRCVDVTPAMAKQVIEELKVQGVAFLVAPYEADAQMAYLARSGTVQLVVTEDSDLLAYGCPRVLYKLDRTGAGEELSLTDLPNCPGLPLSGWTADQFLQLCVMAGCDFLAQLPGIGLKKAHGVLRKYRSFTKVIKMLRFNGTKVPPDYEARFQLALWAFRHARVYCTTEKALIHLAPLPGGGIGAADVDVPAAVTQLEQQQQDQKLDFLGPLLPPEVARGIAEGDLDPNTHKPYDLAAIYAGCNRPPAHLAAQLAALHPAADPAAAGLPFTSSQAAAAAGGGGGAGKHRVGLSKLHAGQSGGSSRRMSQGAFRGAARSSSTQQADAASGGSKKRASLGIARFFQRPPPAAVAAVGGPVSNQAAASTQAGAGAQGIKHSIAKAITTLGQQLQQRHQQQQAEQEQLLQQLTQQQQDDASPEAEDSEAFGLPPAKRHRSSGSLTGVYADGAAAAAAASDSDALAAASDSDALAAAADADTAADQTLQQPTPFFDKPGSSGCWGLLGGSQPPAINASMSLGCGSGDVLASGDTADAGPSQADPSFLCSSSDGLGSQAPRVKGAAVSALSALFGSTAGCTGSFGSSQGLGDMPWGGSQPLSGDGPQDLGRSWDMQVNSSSGDRGGYFSQPPEFGSNALLGSECELGGSSNGCGSSSGLSFGALGVCGPGAAAVPEGAASVSFGNADGQDDDVAAAGAAGSNASFKHLQQSLRTGLRRQQQQQPAATEPGRSSFFSTQQQLQAPTSRRHSRFKEQLLRGASPENGADVLQQTLDGLDGCPELDLQPGSPDGLWEDQEQQLHLQQLRLQSGVQLQQQQAAAGGMQGDVGASQHARLSMPLLLSDSSDPSSSTTGSNDENTDASGALEHLGITHVRQYAKLAHKVVRTVAKQQQQQHAPLATRTGLLNAQAQPPQRTAAAAMQPEAAPATTSRVRVQVGLSKGRGRKGTAASFAAKLAELRYDASMFVPLDQHEQQRRQREQEEEDGQVEDDLLQAAAAEQPRGMFARQGVTSAAAARKPFKAPWLGHKAAPGSPSLSDVLQASEPKLSCGTPDLGLFGDFACGVGGGNAAKRVGAQKRGTKVGLR